MLREQFSLDEPASLRATLGAVVQGRKDPCARWEGDRLWMARHTPDGPVAFALEVSGSTLHVLAKGDGSEFICERATDFVGQHYRQHEFADSFAEDLRVRWATKRIPRTHACFDTIVWTILAQRVTGMEAKFAWSKLAYRQNLEAPRIDGAPNLLLPPTSKFLATLPYFAFHEFGVDRHRAQTIRVAAKSARRIHELTELNPELAMQRMQSLPGIGEWTANEVALFALGHTDAVSVGDFHLKNQIGWALAGQPRSTDEQMVELLEPYRGRRGEIVRFVLSAFPRPPAFGPRYSPLAITQM